MTFDNRMRWLIRVWRVIRPAIDLIERRLRDYGGNSLETSAALERQSQDHRGGETAGHPAIDAAEAPDPKNRVRLK